MNPYEILGCSNNENEEQITKKYKKLALKYHPDRNKSLNKKKQHEYENKFKEITRAYDILKKHNFKYSSNIGNKSNPNKQSKTTSFFTEVLRKQQEKKVEFYYHLTNENTQNLNGIHLNVKSTLKDVYNNRVFYIGVTHDMDCKYCFGSGYRIDTQSDCPKCNGKKKIKEQFDIKVESKLKKNSFKYSGNEELGKKLSNIYIDIKIIEDTQFRIVNEFNILYKVKLSKNIIKEENGMPTIKLKFDYLDNTNKIFTIGKPKKSFSEEYKFEHLGLIKPNNHRGELIINIIDPDMLLFKYK
jgi:DnaJ-class molecular chaperone